MPNRAVLCIGFALLASACRSEVERSPTAAGPSTFRLTANDDGRIVTMHIGDDLTVEAGQSTSSPDLLSWSIVSYPRHMLASIGGIRHGPPFRFVARHAGVGTLRFSLGPPCGGPGPLPENGTNCALPGAGAGQDPTAAGMPTRLITVTVRVYGQG